jgi:dUTP pyrophosphatase
MKVRFKKLDERAITPTKAKEGDACFDLTAVSIKPGNGFLQYGTSLAMEIPAGHVGLIFARSSVTKMDLMLKNSVGVIDSGYRGEICFRFYRTSHSKDKLYLPGERIGQIMIIPLPEIELEEVAELTDSERGIDGYGSTERR